ncbi:hypothetical protein [Desulfotomaculum sp. 1211_IL3151]|uniref:hypothetical protein n=1 Tax=Desulfotomaculum sp. 1211_IL3151 TaxID=3084055 RepID=UPI002FDB6D95
MGSGIGGLIANLLTYPVLLVSISIAIFSAILLLIKGKQLNKKNKILVIVLLIIALSVILFLVIMAIAFGSAHPPASPVRIR